MSISLEPLTANSKPIAQAFIDKSNDIIYINDIDDIDENDKILTKMRLNEENDYFFPVIPNTTSEPNFIYISGPTGCGKTLFCRNYVINFLIKYPKSKVLLFSSKTKDVNIDDLPIIRIKIDDDILINQISLDEIAAHSKPVLVIFDDIEDFKNKKINIEVARLRDEVLRNGRDKNIFGLFVNHDPTDYFRTRVILKECNKYVIFPRRAGVGVYDRLLTFYLKVPLKTQNVITKLKSKYVMINKDVPRYVLTDKYIMVL
jgi:hypothetical protein